MKCFDKLYTIIRRAVEHYMRLTYSRFDLVIEMLENSLNTIVIENKSQMAIVVEEIFQQCEGLEGGFVLSE